MVTLKAEVSDNFQKTKGSESTVDGNIDELRESLHKMQAEKADQTVEYREELFSLNAQNEALRAEINKIKSSSFIQPDS